MKIRLLGLFALTVSLHASSNDLLKLRTSLTHYASFDHGYNADYSRGDPTLYSAAGGAPRQPAANTADIEWVADGGKQSGFIRFHRQNPVRLIFKGEHILKYRRDKWNATVSVWLRLSPDEQLGPGYCDPVSITGGGAKKGFIFLEWSKDETPRFFRYAVRPLYEIWNPEAKDWGEIPFEKRPMIQIANAPFNRERWTHVVFTLDNINAENPTARLFLNGKLQGTLRDWKLIIEWQPQGVSLNMGMHYVGDLDDLAVFDRSLTEAEVQTLFALGSGRELL